MAMFQVGQPVVCIDDRLRPNVVRRYPNMVWPARGQIYTIRANIENRHSTFVLLREIRNRKDRWPGGKVAELGFWEGRFEPAPGIEDIVRAADDVSQFVKGGNSDEWDRVRRVRRKENA